MIESDPSESGHKTFEVVKADDVGVLSFTHTHGQEWCVCDSDKLTNQHIRLPTLGPRSFVLCEVISNLHTGEVIRRPLLVKDLREPDFQKL